MAYFRLYDLLVESQFDLPCDPLAEKEGIHRKPDIVIDYIKHSFSDLLMDRELGSRYDGYLRSYDVGENILLSIDDHIKLLIRKNGSGIFIESEQQDLSTTLIYVIGIGMSIAMACRGLIPLHASCLELGHKVIAIMAESGSGKSTLLWHFMNHGARFITDDVLPMRINDSKIDAISATSILPKLWIDEIKLFSVDQSRCRELLPGENKYWIAVDKRDRVVGYKSVDAFFILEPLTQSSKDCKLKLSQITGSSLLFYLLSNTHAIWALPGYLIKDLIEKYLYLSRSIPVYKIEYLRRYENLADLARAIEEIA
jgi:hypothetical protein